MNDLQKQIERYLKGKTALESFDTSKIKDFDDFLEIVVNCDLDYYTSKIIKLIQEESKGKKKSHDQAWKEVYNKFTSEEIVFPYQNLEENRIKCRKPSPRKFDTKTGRVKFDPEARLARIEKLDVLYKELDLLEANMYQHEDIMNALVISSKDTNNIFAEQLIRKFGTTATFEYIGELHDENKGEPENSYCVKEYTELKENILLIRKFVMLFFKSIPFYRQSKKYTNNQLLHTLKYINASIPKRKNGEWHKPAINFLKAEYALILNEDKPREINFKILAERFGINRSTVSTYMNDHIHEGFIKEPDQDYTDDIDEADTLAVLFYAVWRAYRTKDI